MHVVGSIDIGDGEAYKGYTERLRAVAKKSRKYGYIFNTLAELCNVLELKYDLGKRTRAAYKANDKCELLRLANEDYTELMRRVKKLHRAFRIQWYKENKPSGFEVQDGRFGALVQRLDSCKQRLTEYVNGELDKLEELEWDILPFRSEKEGEPIAETCYGRIVTANQFTHSM